MGSITLSSRTIATATFPVIVDTDGQARWFGTANTAVQDVAFFNNAVYSSNGGTGINRIDLDGSVTFLTDLASAGVTGFHHNIDPGRDGLIIDVNTTTQTESVNIEFNPKTGAILNRWDLADIISCGDACGRRRSERVRVSGRD